MRRAGQSGHDGDPAVPLTLLTGFLGAGKTTLVNHVLNGGLGGPVGVLVNDFGAVDIDRALIAGESEGVLSLQNGCICCSLRDDLVGAVLRLLERPDAPRRVLLEASGVADPAPIAATFMAPAFRRRLRLEGIACVVDAERVFTDPGLVPLQLRQIGFSDLVLLNKTDLAGRSRVDDVTAHIRGEFHAARIIETVRCEVAAEVLFSPPAVSPAVKLPGLQRAQSDAEDHATRFGAWTFRCREAFCADALHELPRELPATLYRAKGIVRIAGRAGRPDRRGVLQIVGRRADLVSSEPWEDRDEDSRIVFIGAAGTLETGQLEHLVRACLRNIDRRPAAPGDHLKPLNPVLPG